MLLEYGVLGYECREGSVFVESLTVEMTKNIMEYGSTILCCYNTSQESRVECDVSPKRAEPHVNPM